MDNKISVTLADEAQTAILQAIATIEKNLPFLINLTNEERQANPKMGDKSLAFVNKACEYAKQNPALVPVFLDIAEFEKDVALANSLSNLLSRWPSSPKSSTTPPCRPVAKPTPRH